jgi:hypothetical protein
MAWCILSNTHADNTHFYKETLFQNGLISSSREKYAFAEPGVHQQGAIGHAYKLIAHLFSSAFK